MKIAYAVFLTLACSFSGPASSFEFDDEGELVSKSDYSQAAKAGVFQSGVLTSDKRVSLLGGLKDLYHHCSVGATEQQRIEINAEHRGRVERFAEDVQVTFSDHSVAVLEEMLFSEVTLSRVSIKHLIDAMSMIDSEEASSAIQGVYAKASFIAERFAREQLLEDLTMYLADNLTYVDVRDYSEQDILAYMQSYQEPVFYSLNIKENGDESTPVTLPVNLVRKLYSGVATNDDINAIRTTLDEAGAKGYRERFDRRVTQVTAQIRRYVDEARRA